MPKTRYHCPKAWTGKERRGSSRGDEILTSYRPKNGETCSAERRYGKGDKKSERESERGEKHRAQLGDKETLRTRQGGIKRRKKVNSREQTIRRKNGIRGQVTKEERRRRLWPGSYALPRTKWEKDNEGAKKKGPKGRKTPHRSKNSTEGHKRLSGEDSEAN